MQWEQDNPCPENSSRAAPAFPGRHAAGGMDAQCCAEHREVLHQHGSPSAPHPARVTPVNPSSLALPVLPTLDLSTQLQLYSLCFLKEIPNVLQGLSGWILSNDGFNFTELLLQRAERLLVWASDSSDFEGISPIQELLSPVSQLADDHVPEGEALVARHAVREEARVAPGALVAARPFHPFIADALPGGAVTLRGLDATRVAVTSWKEKKACVKATVREMMLTLAGRKKHQPVLME